ncbi:YpmS family protein [Shouchella sp. JSM 1781072]|uniref:YpmS family protein n=1 Tax=Bacillaceae TaxID=186817 RepID=UPI000C07DB2A|nr:MULTISPECIES: YpmS family protein [Bacillaceae]UTR07814.1 YpmS family protein [Alkalihalobacillus sp. LMS6]
MSRLTKNRRFYKIGFFLVLGLLLALIGLLIFGAVRLFGDVDRQSPERAGIDSASNEIVSFQMDIEQANVLLNDMLADDDVPFDFYLAEDGVYLEGEVDAVLSTIDLSMRFDPSVQEDGSLLLEANSLSAGFLSVSPENALRMFNQLADLPNWIYLYPEEEHVIIDLREIEELEPFGLRFNELNLTAGEIDVSLVRQ